MANELHAPKRRAWLDNDQLRFALVLAVVALAMIGLLLANRQSGLDLAEPLGVVQHRLKSRHLKHSARALAGACRRMSCDCAIALARAGLDVDAGRETLRALDAGRSCAGGPMWGGVRAEALVRTSAIVEGMDLTNQVLAGKREDPYALLAQGLATYRLGAPADALTLGHESVKAGRGSAAYFLLGSVHVAADQLDEAHRDYRAVLDAEPEDVDALFNLALVADRQHRYGEARSIYLRVLALDPKRKEARFHLGVMAHEVGAEAEAKHHLDALVLIAPGDPLVADLRTALATPAHPPGQVLTIGGPVQ